MRIADEYILRVVVIHGIVVFHVKASGVADIVKQNGKHYLSLQRLRPVYEVDQA